MKKIFVICVALIAFVLFGGIANASAVVIDFSGNAQVSMAGNNARPLKIGLELKDGELIVTGSNSSASILLNSGVMKKISSNAKYIVGSDAKVEHSINLGRGIALAMREVRETGSGSRIHGMVREAKGPGEKRFMFRPKWMGIMAIYPNGTAIKLDGPITFSWSRMPPINWNLPVLVIDDNDGKRISTLSLNANSTAKTVDKSKFKKGRKYSWYLAQGGEKIRGKTVRFSFNVISDSKKKHLSKSLAMLNGLGLAKDGENFLAAQTYYAYGMYYEMTKILKPIWLKSKTPFIRQLLIIGYTKMGRGDELAKLSKHERRRGMRRNRRRLFNRKKGHDARGNGI